MSIIKNEIPILEFDTDTSAIISPDHEQLGLKLPEKAAFAFLGDAIDLYAQKHQLESVGKFVSATKLFPVYITNYKNENICLVQAPVGASASAQILDWMIAYGVKKIISAGSCGALQSYDENIFLVPTRALRDEGTSYHYVSPSRFIDVNASACQAIEKALKEHGLNYTEVTTWSTDGFYRDTTEKVAYRKSEGCSVVEMECSALAACAQMRNAVWGMILYTADSLSDVTKYDERNWGGDSVDYALQLCMDAVIHL